MKNIKKMLSFLLAVMMIVSSINMTVFADGQVGDCGPNGPQSCNLTAGCTLEMGHKGECVLSGQQEKSGDDEQCNEVYQAVVDLFKALPAASSITEGSTETEQAAAERLLADAMDALYDLAEDEIDLICEKQDELLQAAIALQTALGGEVPVTYADDVAQVQKANGTTEGFADLLTAIEAAQPGETIKLIKDWTVTTESDSYTGYVLPDNAVFDLGNHTLTVPYAAAAPYTLNRCRAQWIRCRTARPLCWKMILPTV